jgi:hypothetical protein
LTDKTLDMKPAQLAPNAAADDAAQAKQRKGHNTPDSSYQNYLFGSSGSDANPAWSDSAKGRAAIRLVSRGIVGAAFFTIGGRMATKQLDGYNQATSWGNIERGKPLQYIAKAIDMTLGRGIQKTVTGLARFKHGDAVNAQGISIAEKIGHDAVTFRDTRTYGGNKGRSYGADIVGFTFDFAMASIGDAGTRSIIQAFDPNIKKTWRVNDEGKPATKGENWHFLPGEWLKSTAKTTWRVFSKNQGEDWAAAIPYAFQMKFQRQFLSKIFNKRWDGHQLVFDQGWNGGAYRVNGQGKIIGDMQLAGAIDLHARFTGYNWYTLMFREGYDTIGKAFSDWKKNDYTINLKLPENPIMAPIEAIGQAARYVTKSFIKANMYMNPAVVPFWLFRVPQSKWKAGTIGPKAIASQDANKLVGGIENPEIKDPHSWSHLEQMPETTKLDVVEKRFSQALHPFGWVSNKVGQGAERVAARVANASWIKNSPRLRNFIADKDGYLVGARKLGHDFTDASISYTPYMWAKAETALRVDDNNPAKGVLGEMDISIYKFMDDVASFKFKELPADIKKMWKLGTNFERPTKAREGDEPDAHVIVQAQPVAPTKPTTLVQASSIEQAPNGQQRRVQSANENDYHSDKRWAQMVAGSDINAARFHPASPTRH